MVSPPSWSVCLCVCTCVRVCVVRLRCLSGKTETAVLVYEVANARVPISHVEARNGPQIYSKRLIIIMGCYPSVLSRPTRLFLFHLFIPYLFFPSAFMSCTVLQFNEELGRYSQMNPKSATPRHFPLVAPRVSEMNDSL